ncbi:ABC-type sugar transport system, periplasmic component [Sphaerochaeta pleomorpha str. Grapes]|uniref:ABC-type sugar transport system, periplasmic component n=1 Tax=Sphaerochaeta pleomorpha (strain ATCC BAA-1885 / DSM 22778 / Grapes) TaxID=158190 RepID=G8QY70_SPHPG|nr:extracellular solute-binding protein [Sphaerochaeta pleomorpha]AEV29635.1 ABC-type sugar transport system, periplasmic component [Sphaerochaeta pleomorpha str. Grapes]
MKKGAFLLIALILVLWIPGGVFAQAQTETTGKGPVSIEFWTTETQSDRMATIQVLVDTFTALNPNISINVIPVDENDLATQAQTAKATGTLPALFEGPAETVVSFGTQNMLDIATTTQLIKSIGTDRFYSGPLRVLETTTKGQYYALPYHGWVQGLWYRSDWFKEAGLAPPESWEDILAAAKYFYKPEKNQYGILVGTLPEAYTEQCFTPIAMSNGAALFTADKTLVFNSPQMKEAVTFYAELAKYNPPGPQTWRARDYYLQGKMAMFFYSTYIMDDLAVQEVAAGSLTGENFSNLQGTSFDPELVTNTEIASMVYHRFPAGYGTVVALGLFNQTDKAKTEAARKFIEYLYTQNAYITFLHMAPGGMNPMLKEIATNPRFQNDPSGLFKRYGQKKMAEIIDGLENVRTFSIVDGTRIEEASEITAKQIIPQMLYKITQENMPIDAAMSWAEAEMRKLM